MAGSAGLLARIRRHWAVNLLGALAGLPLVVVLAAPWLAALGPVASVLFGSLLAAPVVLYLAVPAFRVPAVSLFLPFVVAWWLVVAHRFGQVPPTAAQLDALQARCVDAKGAWSCDGAGPASFTDVDVQRVLVLARALHDDGAGVAERGMVEHITDGVEVVARGGRSASGSVAERLAHAMVQSGLLVAFVQGLFLLFLPSGLYLSLRAAAQASGPDEEGADAPRRAVWLLGRASDAGLERVDGGAAAVGGPDYEILRDVFFYASFAVACAVSLSVLCAPVGIGATLAGEVVAHHDMRALGPLWFWVSVMPKASPLAFACVGYLLYAMLAVGLAIGAGSVSSQTFLRLGRRGALVLLAGVAFTGLAGDGVADSLLGGTPHVLALVAGLVPGVALTRLGGLLQPGRVHGLERVPDLGATARGALVEAGVESLTDLAAADIALLVVQTGLPRPVIAALVDKALLAERVPTDVQEALARVGILRASDLQGAPSVPDALDAVVANLQDQLARSEQYHRVLAALD